MAKPDPAVSPSKEATERTANMYPAVSVSPNDDIDLRVVWNAVIRDRLIVVSLSLLGLIVGAAYAWLTPSWYRAEVRLLPEALGGRSPLGTPSSPVGELAGMSAITLERDMNSQSIALMRSHDFVRAFLVDEGLVAAVSGLTGANPDVESAVGLFAGRLISIREDLPTGTVTLGIDWKDAATAADVANRMAARVNRVSRERAVSEATANVGYLREQLAETQDSALRDVISKLLQMELQKLVVAKGRDEFAFRVIDAARPPGERYWPRWRITVAAGFVGGLMLALAIVLVRSVSRRPAR